MEAMDMHCDAIDSGGGGQSVPRLSRGANGAALHARTGWLSEPNAFILRGETRICRTSTRHSESRNISPQTG
jgi:hypothetical protein